MGDRGSRLPPLGILQSYRDTNQYWSGSPENHKATKPAFNVWLFKWRFAGGPMIDRFKRYLDPVSPHQLIKTLTEWSCILPSKTFRIHTCG